MLNQYINLIKNRNFIYIIASICLMIIFILTLIGYLNKNINVLNKVVKHNISRDNVEFVVSQVHEFNNHNSENIPTIYLNGPDPALFFLTHGGYKKISYYEDYLSKKKLLSILDTNDYLYLVGYNPIFLTYRHHTRKSYLKLNQNDEITIKFNSNLENAITFSFQFYDDLNHKHEVLIKNLLNNIEIKKFGIEVKRDDNEITLKTNNGPIGLKLCYKNCLSGWMLGKSVELLFKGKNVDLSLKMLKDKYGNFDVINSSGSLFFGKTKKIN